MEIIRLLNNSSYVDKISVLDRRIFKEGYYIKIKVTFINKSELHLKEYIAINERNYSYHWQSKDGKMINRWDNAHHYPDLDSYPHHKHTPTNITSNFKISFEEIFQIIEDKLKTQCE